MADAGRPCRIVDAEACFLDADACSRTQRPASLQNVERSVGLQALGPKLDVGFFWTQGQGSLGKRDIEAKEQIIF